jgi:Caspase domain
MAKRALLIGSQTYGLAGVNGDVALMAETLEGRGFQTDVRIDDAATRAGIVAAYEQLIDQTPNGSTDPVVIYYSGHGGRTPLEGWEELQRRGQRSHLRYLVPFDMAASSETDFRGLLSEELSSLQRRLTAKTENVTTILDCCHSGTMSRDADLMPKAAPRSFPFEAALPLLEELEAGSGGATTLDDSNPLAVRLVACDPTQSAYERPSSLGGRHGALTEQLVLSLRELGDRPLTWRVLGNRIRRMITTSLPTQRPEVEGPSDRLLFSLTTRGAANALPVAVADGAVHIEAAGLFGVSVGDRYELVSSDDSSLGQAEVERIDGDTAVLDVPRKARAGDAYDGAVAVPVRTSRTKAVALDLEPAVRAAVEERLTTSTMLHAAAAGEDAVARITGDGTLTVLDGGGFAVQEVTFASDAAGIGDAVTLVERVARAERLRALDRGDAELANQVHVELRSHVGSDGGVRTRAANGERLYCGERISLLVTNNSGRDLYVGLFDIDTAYAITLLSADEPAGWRLPAGETKPVGGPDGVPLEWDAGVPDDAERPETLLVVAATQPQQFDALTTGGATRGEVGGGSSLESLLAEAGTGTRGWPASRSESVAYCAKPVDFYLVPAPPPALDEPPFAIEDLPDPSERELQPRSAVAPPTRLAVRLVNLRVQHNKALFKAAVRVDALILTGSDQQVIATPFTFRFPDVADGDLLPADNLLLYHGDVKDFLDIAIWANRDDEKGVDLAVLFEQAVNDSTVQGALAVVGGLVVAAAPAAAAAAAVGAVATVVRVGASLISAAVGKEIGLYRTSFLPFEQFGLGRQPREGFRTAKGIEFAYEVVDPG